jgi:hypothetical protein
MPFAPPAAASADDLALAQPVGQMGPDGLELLALTWGPEANVSQNAARSLTLYWRANRPIPDDLRVALRVKSPCEEATWEWKRSPGAGRFSTDRWPTGYVMADTYRAPNQTLSGATGVEVRVYRFPQESPLAQLTLPLPRP